MKIKFLLLILGMYLPFILWAQNQNLTVTSYKLSNGLTVYLNEDHTLPQIYGGVAVNAGGKYDPANNTGMGHYLEHMLFKGTETMGTVNFAQEKPYLDKINALYDSLGMTKDEAQRAIIQKKINEQAVKAAEFAVPNEMDRLLKSFGSVGVNAFTAQELICYHNRFPSNEIEKWLTLYADRFQNPVFRLFQSELEVVYEEKNRGMDNMGNAVFEKFQESFFKKHPYGQSIIGKTEHLKNPSLNQMYAYYNQYYVPNNMALVLCGDFDSEKIKPLIEAKFGGWKPGNVPTFTAPKEDKFNGREVLKTHLTPIKAGIMGFRTVPNGHGDAPALEVASYLLSNQSQTGFLDKLATDRKIMLAQAIPLQLNDEGAYIIIVVPKILGQSIQNAENLVLAEINKIKKGQFTKGQLEAAKNQLILSFYQNLENNTSRCFTIAELFTQKRSWEEYMQYPEKIRALTVEDIAEITSKMLGDNYLIMTSTTGFPKKDKLSKPEFKPVIPKEGVESEYARNFKNIPSGKIENPFVDINADVQKVRLAKGGALFYTANPLNDIFSLTLEFNMGTLKNKNVSKVADYLNLVGSKNLPFQQFKSQLDSLGCTVSFNADEFHFEVEIDGMEKNRDAATAIVMEMMKNPEVSEEKIKNLIDESKFEPRLFKRDAQSVGSAALSYVMYGEKSEYINKLTQKEVKALTAAQLVTLWGEIMQEAPDIFYVGTGDATQLAKKMDGILPTGSTSRPAIEKPMRNYAENKIVLLNDGKARQSQVYFYIQGGAYSIEDEAKMDAFNSYFGGDMSALMFQEIREFRSLAYSTSGTYKPAQLSTWNGYFTGYIGCQSDKTLEAVSTLHGMLTDMPQKPERIEAIASGLSASIASKKPGFREVGQKVAKWRLFGYKADPYKAKADIYPTLKFEDINEFYNKNLKGKPIVIVISGNTAKFDKAALGKYGTITEISLKDVYKE